MGLVPLLDGGLSVGCGGCRWGRPRFFILEKALLADFALPASCLRAKLRRPTGAPRTLRSWDDSIWTKLVLVVCRNRSHRRRFVYGRDRRRGCGSGFSLFGVVDLALAAAVALSFSRDRSSVGFEYR